MARILHRSYILQKILPMITLKNFHHIRPQYAINQSKLLEWLAKAHTQSAATEAKDKWTVEEQNTFYQTIYHQLKQLGLGEGKIATRASCLHDPTHFDWERMEVYSLLDHPAGKCMSDRMVVFDRVSKEAVEEFYKDEDLPRHLIQVTCTGYVSPSAIQNIISKRQSSSYATHAFHMGCYGALAAVRMAAGLVEEEIDIVHTELCSLHMNPQKHDIGQLVSQTLFADGLIKYRVTKNSDGLNVMAIHEEIIPNTLQAMDWRIGNWGMQIFLDKTIPIKIKTHLKIFLQNLFIKAKIPIDELSSYYFAIHPGGPKIIESLQKLLDLPDRNIAHTREILRDFGNMSSATLPHIWQALLNDDKVLQGSKIVSLAFGPGLTIFGAIMNKGGA